MLRPAVGLLLVCAFGLQDPSPREIIRHLPVIDASSQCKAGACDRTASDSVFQTLNRLGVRYLQRGMSAAVAESIFGPPSEAPNGERLRWTEPRFGNEVEVRTYAVSVSGTVGYHLVLVNGCLERFAAMQTTSLYAMYGRPGWSADPVSPYRFTRKESGVCRSRSP